MGNQPDPRKTRRTAASYPGAGPGAAATALLAGLMAGCAEAPTVGVVESAVEVGSFEETSCSTAVVIALSAQVADEVDCLMPGQMVPFAEVDGIVFASAAVLPYLDAAARDDLYAAAASGGALRITSAFRSVVQQYLIRTWYEQGRCGITAAAQPGASNHEGGRAIDVDNWSAWTSALGAHGWAHDVPGDDVHFDHTASPDIRGADVLAFQRLWNANRPDDPIAADGEYGAETAARIAVSPAEGFPIGASCGPSDRGLDVVSITGPERIGGGEHAVFTARLANLGTTTWPAAAVLATATGAPSVLADGERWRSPSEVVALGRDVAPGEEIELDIPVVGPAVDVATPVAERFALVDAGGRFGAVPVAVTVDPERGVGSGGCRSTDAGGAAPWLVVLAALVDRVCRRRRRPGRFMLRP